MIKLLGYDFVTKEKVKWFKQKEMIIDDVAVVRRNRPACQRQRSGSIVEDTNRPSSSSGRRQCYSMQPDSFSMVDDSLSLCSMISEPVSPLEEFDEEGNLEDPLSAAACSSSQLPSASRNSISGGSMTSIAGRRKRLLALARKSFKVPFANFRRMSEPGLDFSFA